MYAWKISINSNLHWGYVDINMLGSVLELCSKAFLQCVTKNPSDRDIVIYAQEEFNMQFPAPAVLPDRYHRASHTVLLLSAKERYWCQYMYQLAHELCHYISNYNQYELALHTPNNWFIESVCEVASRFTLREVAGLWEKRPPYVGAESFVPSILDYYNGLGNKTRLSAEPFIFWFKNNEANLRSNPILRDLNHHIADYLEPYFTRESWQSLRYLNIPAPNTTSDLKSYFQNWLINAPSPHHGFITQIAHLFEVNLT